MSNRLKGLTVVFKNDIKDEDADRIIDAIGMIKGISCVISIPATPDDYINRERVKRELIDKLFSLLRE